MFKPVSFTPDATGALSGIRVLDLSRLVCGNTLSMALADLGADVLKVEPLGGDTLRDWKVKDVATAWKAYARNKRSLCMNFRGPDAPEILLRLAAHADVFIESFRPGALEAMGVPPDVLLERNPKLVIARISGWGQDGPYARRPGFGTLVEGMSGFASMNGFADREPVLPPIYLGDMTAGLYGAVGVLAALRHVEVNGGHGQVIDVNLLDPTFTILGAQAANYRLTGKIKPRTGSRSTNSAPRNAYRTADDKWVCLSGSTQGMAERLLRSIGRPELITDPRFARNADRLANVEELDRIIGDFIVRMTKDECLRFFEEAEVTIGPIYDMSDIETDPHFHARGVVVELPDEDMGSMPVHTISPRLLGTPGTFRRAAPKLGEHTVEALTAAGFTPAEVDALKSGGAIATGVEAPR